MGAKQFQYAICGAGIILVTSLGLIGVILVPGKETEISGFCGIMLFSLIKHAYDATKIEDVKQAVANVAEVTAKTEKMVNSATGVNLVIAQKAASDLVAADPTKANIKALDIAQAKVEDHETSQAKTDAAVAAQPPKPCE